MWQSPLCPKVRAALACCPASWSVQGITRPAGAETVIAVTVAILVVLFSVQVCFHRLCPEHSAVDASRSMQALCLT